MAPGSGSLNSGDLNDQHRKAWTLEMHMMPHDGTCKIGEIGAFCVHHVWRTKRAHRRMIFWELMWADSKTLTAACFSRISAGRSAPKTILNHFVLFRHDILKFWRCPQCFKTVTSFNHWDVPHGKRYMSSTSSTTRFGNVVLEDQQVNCYWGSTLNQTSHREASVHTAENNRAAWAFPRWGQRCAITIQEIQASMMHGIWHKFF